MNACVIFFTLVLYGQVNMVVPNLPNQITCTNVGDKTIKELDSLYKTNKFRYTCVTTCK